MSIEAMKLALEWIEAQPEPRMIGAIRSINALHKAIEQAQKQEPDDLTAAYMSGFYDGKNKCAPQRQWVGLTEEEYKKIRYGSDESDEPYVSYALYDFNEDGIDVEIHVDNFAKAIEAKLKEKNA